MKNITKLNYLLFFLIIGSSCTYIYYPTYPVVPDAEDEAFGLQGTIGFTKAQISAWYAMDSSLYFTGTLAGALSLTGDGDSSTTRKFGSKTFTVGAGYKFPLSKDAEFNLQGGAGLSQGFFRTGVFPSKIITPIPVFGHEVKTNSIRLYLQPSFKIDRGNGGFYIIPRITYENFTKVSSITGNLEFKPSGFLISELFLLGRFNTKAVNIDLYLGIAGNLTQVASSDIEDTMIAQPIALGFGLSKTFGQ